MWHLDSQKKIGGIIAARGMAAAGTITVEFVTDNEVLRKLVLGLLAEERYEDRSLVVMPYQHPRKLYSTRPVCCFFEVAMPAQISLGGPRDERRA